MLAISLEIVNGEHSYAGCVLFRAIWYTVSVRSHVTAYIMLCLCSESDVHSTRNTLVFDFYLIKYFMGRPNTNKKNLGHFQIEMNSKMAYLNLTTTMYVLAPTLAPNPCMQRSCGINLFVSQVLVYRVSLFMIHVYYSYTTESVSL